MGPSTDFANMGPSPTAENSLIQDNNTHESDRSDFNSPVNKSIKQGSFYFNEDGSKQKDL